MTLAGSLVKVRLVLRGHAKPHIRVPMAPVRRQHFQNVLRSVRQQQPIQTATVPDQGKQVLPPRRRNLTIKDVGKRHKTPTLDGRTLV